MTTLGIFSFSITFVTFAFSVWPHLSKLFMEGLHNRSLPCPYKRQGKLLIPQCPLAVCFFSCHLQKWTNTTLGLGFCIFTFASVVFLQACHLNGSCKLEKQDAVPGLCWAADARCCPRQSCWSCLPGHDFIKIADICHAERSRASGLFVKISQINSYRWNLIHYLCNKPLRSVITLDCY